VSGDNFDRIALAICAQHGIIELLIYSAMIWEASAISREIALSETASTKQTEHPIPEATALLPWVFAIQVSDAPLVLKTAAHFDLFLRPLAAPYDRPISDKVV